MAGLSLCVSTTVLASPSDVGGPNVSKDFKWKMTLEYKDDTDVLWVLPKIAYSRPLSPVFEAELAVSRLTLEREGGTQSSGVGDVEIKGKWALVSGDGARPGIALEPKVILPAGPDDSGLGVNKAQFELPILVAWQGTRTGLYTKAGYRQGFGGETSLQRYMGGVLVTYQQGPRARWGLDVYADAPRRDTDQYKVFANVGVNWYVSRSLEVQALIGRSIRHPDDRDAYKAKFVIEYKFAGNG